MSNTNHTMKLIGSQRWIDGSIYRTFEIGKYIVTVSRGFGGHILWHVVPMDNRHMNAGAGSNKSAMRSTLKWLLAM